MFGMNPIDYIGAPKHAQRGKVYKKIVRLSKF